MATEMEFKPTCEMQHMLPKLRTPLCQLLEELKIRRENDRENEKRISELVSIQHGLEEKLEEGAIKLQRDREEQQCKLEEQRKMFEDQVKESEEEKMKAKLLYNTSMKEIKSLRDEIRKLHLSKFTLEKIIKDQECKLQLMNSSRESYQLQMSQIETQSSRCSQQLVDLEAALALLQSNVNAAVSVNEEVRKQNASYRCQLDKMRAESERLLERVYKNPLYAHDPQHEGRRTADQARMQASVKFNEERIAEMERELVIAHKTQSNTQRSLQESHRLMSEQARAQRRVEEEVGRVEQEKREIREEGERETEHLRSQVRGVEIEKEEIQKQLSDTRDKLNESLWKLAELRKTSIGEEPLCSESGGTDNVIQIEAEEVVLAPDSQEGLPRQGEMVDYTRSCSVIECSQESDEKEVIQLEKNIMTYSINTSPRLPNSPIPLTEMPNKKSKLDSDPETHKESSPLSTHSD